MMNYKLALVGIAMAVSAFAADPTGKWTSEFQGPQGNTVRNIITLKADGENVTGSVQGMRGGQTPISDGKVAGDQVTFSVVREWQGEKIKMLYHGTLKGNVIHFAVTREGGQGGGREFDAKRDS
jgi:hypothetical protein